MNYVKLKLVYEVIKKKEKELQKDDLALFSRQVKGSYFYQYNNSKINIKKYYICIKSYHFIKNCNDTKKEDIKNIKNTIYSFGRNDYTFIVNERASMAALSKQIINLGTTKHVILYKYSFNTYEAILVTNGWNKIAQFKPLELILL